MAQGRSDGHTTTARKHEGGLRMRTPAPRDPTIPGAKPGIRAGELVQLVLFFCSLPEIVSTLGMSPASGELTGFAFASFAEVIHGSCSLSGLLASASRQSSCRLQHSFQGQV
eukprot:352113-Chlamydomonas_euryale.AAC.1